MAESSISAWPSIIPRATQFSRPPASSTKSTELSSEAFSNILAEVQRGGSTDVDLLIRTGGETTPLRFSTLGCAFAEFCFSPKRWPDFTPKDLRDMVKEFEQRERTRGGLPREAEL